LNTHPPAGRSGSEGRNHESASACTRRHDALRGYAGCDVTSTGTRLLRCAADLRRAKSNDRNGAIQSPVVNGGYWPEGGRNRQGLSRVAQGWSTAGSTLTSTGSRPLDDQRSCNRGNSVVFAVSAQTITSSIWRRILMGTAGLEGVGCPSKSRSYRWGRRRSRRYTEDSDWKSDG
jgi:hypothetical protein